MSLWEKGGQSPSLPLIPVLARELAVPIGYLLAGQDAPVPLADTLDAVAHSARLAAAAVTGLAADKIEIEIRIKA